MTQALEDPFAIAYSRPEGTKVPTGRHIHGRLIAVIPAAAEPVKIVPNEKGGPGAVQKRLIADVIVCDGGIIFYGGDLNIPGSDTSQMPAPCVIPSMWLYGDALIEQIMNASVRGVVLGRIVKKPTRDRNKSYWTVEMPTDQDKLLALPLFRQYQAGTLFSASDLPPVNAPGQLQPLAPQFGMQGQAAPISPAQPSWPAQASTANPFQLPPVPPADWTLAAMPKDFPGTADQWIGTDMQTRAGFLAHMGITGPNQQPTGL